MGDPALPVQQPEISADLTNSLDQVTLSAMLAEVELRSRGLLDRDTERLLQAALMLLEGETSGRLDLMEARRIQSRFRQGGIAMTGKLGKPPRRLDDAETQGYLRPPGQTAG